MILSFCFMTPFMMPSMVLEPESWLPRYVEYFMACRLPGDEPTGVSADTGSMPLSSKKLYTSTLPLLVPMKFSRSFHDPCEVAHWPAAICSFTVSAFLFASSPALSSSLDTLRSSGV
uniref:Uncharacterized protein n=1 Tax=Arundo donax TaxID=35708 RepID=A0A0A9DJS2_ARUDO